MKYEPSAGESLQEACRKATRLALDCDGDVMFEFNDQHLTATPTSSADKLAQSYLDECDRAHKAWLESPEYAAQQVEQERKQQEKDAALTEALAVCPPRLTVRDAVAWQSWQANNTDPYGAGIMSYAERWGRLMEGALSRGEKLESVAESTSHLADNDGLTGFMYGAAVSVLAKVWVHGEDLRRWHNLKTQIKDEGERANASGGVLNPALLHIG